MRMLSTATIMLAGGCQQSAAVGPMKISGGTQAEIVGELITAVDRNDVPKMAVLAPNPRDIRVPGQKFDVHSLKADGCHWTQATARGQRVELAGRCEAPPCVTPWKAEMEVADQKIVAGAVYWWDC